MTVRLEELNQMAPAAFAAAVGEAFERAPWVAETASSKRPFATVSALHEAMMGAVRAAPRERQLEFLRGHPDLAGKAARAGAVTDESRHEQASVGLDSLSEEEFARFHRLNDAYKARFGFPFIVCVRRHTRDSILAQFERRLGNDAATEFAAALQEVFYITRLRIAAKVAGEGMPQVNGRLSTHVLDTHAGRPAVGVAVELYEFAGERAHRIASAVTNADGRTDRPLIGDRPLADRPLRIALRRGQPLSQQGYRQRRSALPRYRGFALFHCRAGGALSRPIALHALELFDLSRKLRRKE